MESQLQKIIQVLQEQLEEAQALINKCGQKKNMFTKIISYFDNQQLEQLKEQREKLRETGDLLSNYLTLLQSTRGQLALDQSQQQKKLENIPCTLVVPNATVEDGDQIQELQQTTKLIITLKLINDDAIQLFKKYKVPTEEENITFYNGDDISQKDVFFIGRDKYTTIGEEQTNVAQISSSHFKIQVHRQKIIKKEKEHKNSLHSQEILTDFVLPKPKSIDSNKPSPSKSLDQKYNSEEEKNSTGIVHSNTNSNENKNNANNENYNNNNNQSNSDLIFSTCYHQDEQEIKLSTEDQDTHEPEYTYIFEIENLGRNGTYLFKSAKGSTTTNNNSDNTIDLTNNDMYQSWRGKWKLLEYNKGNSKAILENGDIIGLIKKKNLNPTIFNFFIQYEFKFDIE